MSSVLSAENDRGHIWFLFSFHVFLFSEYCEGNSENRKQDFIVFIVFTISFIKS